MKNEYKLQFGLLSSFLVLFLVFSNIYYLRIDITKQKLYTLSNYTKSILNSIDSTLQISWFRSSNISSFASETQYLYDLLKEFELHSNCVVSLYNTDEIEEKKLHDLGLIPQSIETMEIHGSTTQNLYSGIVIQLKGLTRVIPFIASISNLEYDIDNFILQLDDEYRNVKNRVALLSVEKENEYIKRWLKYAGFTVEDVALPLKEELKLDIPLIVIGSKHIDKETSTYIDVFLKKKGNAIFFVSANTIDVKGDWSAKKKANDSLIEMLTSHGIEIASNLVLDIANYPIRMNSEDGSSSQTINYPFWPSILHENIKSQELLSSGINNIQTFWPSSIIIEEKRNWKELATTTKEGIILDKDYNTDPFANSFSLFSQLEKKKRCIATYREKPSRIVVISDENMIGSAIEYTNSSSNLDFAVNCVQWVSHKDKLLELKNKKHILSPFKFHNDEDVYSIVKRARIICFAIIPLLIILGAIYFFITRRVKNNAKA
ncbi:MAG: GldG family protein [Treponema sp.]